MKLYQFEGVDDLLENPDGVVPIRRAIIKPLITCEHCSYLLLKLTQENKDGISYTWCRYRQEYVELDDHCKYGTPKEAK